MSVCGLLGAVGGGGGVAGEPPSPRLAAMMSHEILSRIWLTATAYATIAPCDDSHNSVEPDHGQARVGWAVALQP